MGPCIEMAGRSGGWIVNDFHPIGLSTEQALATIAEFGTRWFPPDTDGEDDEGEDSVEEWP